MKKIEIKLDNCWDCPYAHPHGEYQGKYCSNPNRPKKQKMAGYNDVCYTNNANVQRTLAIPNWCPLETIKENFDD